MNVWLAASIAMLAGLLACTLACLRRSPAAALAALNVAGVTTVLILVTLSVAFARQPFIDLAVVLVALSVGGSLAFVRFLESKR